jgi:hypothetical protein
MNNIKKNVLDLYFHKHLIIASTSIIIIFTYFIGVGIGILTNQIRFDNLISTTLLAATSLTILIIVVSIFFNSVYHIKNIPRIVKNLK